MMKRRVSKYIFLTIVFGLLNTFILAQDAGVQMVYLEHSKTLSFDENRLPNVQILKGDVRFRHDSVLMYCDSAYFFEKLNELENIGDLVNETDNKAVNTSVKTLLDPQQRNNFDNR